jgi:hypothetical protein
MAQDWPGKAARKLNLWRVAGAAVAGMLEDGRAAYERRVADGEIEALRAMSRLAPACRQQIVLSPRAGLGTIFGIERASFLTTRRASRLSG